MLEAPQNPQEPLWLIVMRLLRWHKPEGRLILMIPALWAVFLAAAGQPPIPLVAVIICGSIATSAAGCVVNDLWDRDIDPRVERTRDRPLAARTLSIQVGIIVGVIALICAAIMAFYLNPLSFWLSVAAVPVIVLYPGAKRVFPIPQLVLSLAWGFAVLISWSAVTANLSTSTWLLWAATVLWTLGFDTIYAMSDREDDKRIGVNSSAIFFGKYSPIAIGIFFIGTIIFLGATAFLTHLNLAFWITLTIATIAWIGQIISLQNPKIANTEYGKMFRQNVWIGFLILLGIIIGCQ